MERENRVIIDEIECTVKKWGKVSRYSIASDVVRGYVRGDDSGYANRNTYMKIN